MFYMDLLFSKRNRFCYLDMGVTGSVSLKVVVSEDLKEGEWNGIGARR